MIDRLFLEHPRSMGEGYLQHQRTALSFAGELMLAGLACAVHALIPCLFERAGSQAIQRLHARMVLNRSRHATPPRAGEPLIHGIGAFSGGEPVSTSPENALASAAASTTGR